MFEIAVDTCSANCATRCSIRGGKLRSDLTAMAPQVRPSTTIGPAAAARIPWFSTAAATGPVTFL
jgi:hypothetical protein